MLFLALSAHRYLSKRCWIVTELLIFFLLQDFIDRVFFNIHIWSVNDSIVIGLIILQYIIKTYVRLKK